VQEQGTPASDEMRDSLRDVLSTELRQHFVDEGLVADPTPACFFPEPLEDCRIHADGDELTRCVAKRRSATSRIAFN
jgi:hypothetical protein